MARKLFALSALAWLCLGMTAHAQPAEQARVAEINALMSRYAGDVPGASLLVIKDGKAVVRRGFGYANLEAHIKAAPETNYRLASVTKQFTAACILLLKQDGKLKLTDPVRTWLPELPASDDKITIGNLLAHTSGLVDYEDLIPPDRTTQINDADVLRMIASQHRLYFDPGSAHRYSNGGYVLLGLIVERISGMDLADFMKRRIFQPLGMDHTLMYEHDRGPQVPDRAYGYSEADGKWTRTDQSVTSATRGDGGVYSNIDDLAKWNAALYTDKLLDADSRNLAFTPKDPTDDPDVLYGFGWRLSGDTMWHSGESMGFRNVIIRWPQRHLAVIILSNRNEFQPYPAALTIGELFPGR
ncbi:MAG: serine hydrolase domain-containing protein [Rhodanobacteraceae bacterium]